VHTSTAAGRTATGTVSVVVGSVLVAFNLRAGIAAVSPLLPDIRDDLVWSVLAGLAQGAAISLAFALIVLRARTADVARRLSGTVQSAGYLIGAAGPIVLGALRDGIRSWNASLAALLVAVALMAVGAWGAGRNQVVG
jgi:cyanate permease